MKAIVFMPAAARQWTKLPADIRKRIDPQLIAFASGGQGDVKRLRGRGGSRLRVGDWRVIFDETSTEIRIVAVGHRREVYK